MCFVACVACVYTGLVYVFCRLCRRCLYRPSVCSVSPVSMSASAPTNCLSSDAVQDCEKIQTRDAIENLHLICMCSIAVGVAHVGTVPDARLTRASRPIRAIRLIRVIRVEARI